MTYKILIQDNQEWFSASKSEALMIKEDHTFGGFTPKIYKKDFVTDIWVLTRL